MAKAYSNRKNPNFNKKFSRTIAKNQKGFSKKQESFSKRRTPKKPKPKRFVPPPIVDEENPIPDKYTGDIVFNKTIYSKVSFEDKIDTGFNELTSNQLSISIEEFFDLYNEMFFDIPKEGENSHSTIIQTSLDYVNDYENPLQALLDAQASELEAAIVAKNEAETRLDSLIAQQAVETAEREAEEAAEAAAEAEAEAQAAAAQAAYEATYGSDYVNNPQLEYSKLKINLNTMAANGQLRKSKNKNEKDLRQAKEKENNNTNKRSYNEWNSAIQKRAEGKVKDDLRDLISATRSSIAAGNGWRI